MINITMNDGQGNSKDYIIRWEKNPNGKVTTHVVEKKFYRMKHYATAIQEVADNTGYDYDFLCGVAEELEKAGLTAEEVVDHISQVAYKRGFKMPIKDRAEAIKKEVHERVLYLDIKGHIYVILAMITPVKYLNKWMRICEKDAPFSKLDIFKWNIADHVCTGRKGLTY